MSDVVPSLDTIEFDQLVEQARGDIPRYAPDWTDHNLHDPGMTFIDLLAWIVDQQVYRAGFVGGRHERAFAALLGQRAGGPEPARGLVWPNGRVRDARFIDAGSEVVCLEHPDLSLALEWPDTTAGDVDGSGERRSIYFPSVTLRTVCLAVDGVELPAAVSGSGDGSWVIGDGGRTSGTVLTLAFDGPLGAGSKPANVLLGVDVAPPPGPPPSAGDLHSWGPVTYSYRVGEGEWVEVDVVHDGTLGLASTGVVLLAIPSQETAHPRGSELRLDLDGGFFPVPPQLRAMSVNVVPVVQRKRVPGAPFTASGTGQPDQTVELDTSDLVPASSRPDGPLLEIKVGKDVWTEQTDFSRSGPRDRHFVVRPDRVMFGNGVNGDRPKLGAALSYTELARSRGAAGNLPRGMAWSIPALGASGAGYGRNRQALAGGRARTERSDLAIACQDAATRRSALVTDDDLVGAAYALPGMAVGRAEVVPGFDHRLPDRHVDGVRTLLVLPHQASGGGARRPRVLQPSQEYLSEVAERLDARRVLGERLIVRGPVIVEVDLALVVTPEAGTVPEAVRGAVEHAVTQRLSPVRSNGADPWPLGRDLTTCELEAITANVPGVATVTQVGVAVAGRRTTGAPVMVPRDGLVVVHDIDIDIEVVDASAMRCTSPTARRRGPTR